MTDKIIDEQFLVLHKTINDNQLNGFKQLKEIGDNVNRIASSVEKIQLQQNIKLEHHDSRLTAVEGLTQTNNDHRLKTKPWLIIGGFIGAAVITALVNGWIVPPLSGG